MEQIPIYTIGYGAREIEDFITVLKEHHIAYLLDIRSRPYSRYKPDFSKNQLVTHLEANGIRYVYMGDTLGGLPKGSEYYTHENKVDYPKVRESSFYQAGIARIKEAYRQQLSIVLMCSEGKPENCHRSRLIGDTLNSTEIPVAHIDEQNQIISQDEVDLRETQGQMPLFGEELKALTSRKKYQSPDSSE